MKRFHPAMRLSIGLVLLTISLLLSAYFFGLVPDGQKSEISARAKVAEALAVQLADAASRNEIDWVKATMGSVVERNPDVLSAALRRENGELAVSSGNHAEHWTAPADGKSTPTHVTVPLSADGKPWGFVELAFRQPSSNAFPLGFPVTVALLMAFLAGTGLLGYYWVLRRALHELDPGKVIPERVQKAFDTLSEGVIVIDDRERILMVNSSFRDMFGQTQEQLIGQKINMLPWRFGADRDESQPYPWFVALGENSVVKEELLHLRSQSGAFHSLLVNVSQIAEGTSKPIGAIVTLNDVSELQRKNNELGRAVSRLQETEKQVKAKNRELVYLANHDPLSGCLNRRAFFSKLEATIDETEKDGRPVTCVMVDLDHFKRINDTYGHTAGDAVITGVADILKTCCEQHGFVGRYGGEEFCIALVGMPDGAAVSLVEELRGLVEASSQQLLPNGWPVTASIGYAARARGDLAASNLIERADRALYAAKDAGRNRAIGWSPELDEPAEADGKSRRRSDQEKGQPRQSALPSPEPKSATPMEAFGRNLAQSITQCQSAGTTLAVLHISFRSVDYLAESVGPSSHTKFRRLIERRLTTLLREEDRVLPLENCDDFLIEANELNAPGEVSIIIDRLMNGMADPVSIEDQTIYLDCRIGVAVFPDAGKSAGDLIRNAAIAVRMAKDKAQNNTYQIYSPTVADDARERLSMETAIRRALKEDAFELYFQPIIDVRTGALTSAEALLRIQSKELAGIGMGKIIEVAEKSSLIADIDEWVLARAFSLMGEWVKSGIDIPKISINLSAQQLVNAKLMDRTIDMIKELDFPASRLQIEITETAMLSDTAAAAPPLSRLQQLGLQIALDDFGTGHSSLSYLQLLSPDIVKIDRSFIDRVHSSHANATLVSAMIVMAHCLGLQVVAEGVETESQLDFLRASKCDEIQGYLISHPMPANVFADWAKLFSQEKAKQPRQLAVSDEDRARPVANFA